jgi:hypothetical protein
MIEEYGGGQIWDYLEEDNQGCSDTKIDAAED